MKKNLLKFTILTIAITTLSTFRTEAYFSDHEKSVDNKLSSCSLNQQTQPNNLTDILITEVYYNPAESPETDYEWIEIYNTTTTSINLENWKILDNTESPITFDDNDSIESNTFKIVSKNNTVKDHWNLTDNQVITLNSWISGLNNSGDKVVLKNSTGEVIDSMSYGNNTEIFNPACTPVNEGNSFERKSLLTDTDTANDWRKLESPTPGS